MTEKYTLSRTNNILIRGATLIHETCACMDTDISPTTDVCHHVAEYWEKIFSFDCALSGPFAKQFLIRLSAARTLCAVLHDVISASTVFDGSIISQYHIFVKKFSEFFVMIVHNHHLS